ncbi:hypothetical protein ABEF92_008380 [Exophiala dermatitidis]|uniref:Uncharacterized protein n=1 Tax=Exophiala dermatitidis (strain ATCC 34100 / CBS 525.76 / NIH/UT8656) TaxID=858893 RepID=H6C7T5_EXODN|nr:uncharacterized protein HMPREF1120_07710 [Exophiala dermatitidis NIH/UT8656]EHY59727.1 hypothetical protein HMPREF1120_07710 [Exophiala dermatitidis NIH/UT8656]KAJ4522516.1 hypothetical protein HRR75_000910 [Exophiala dermatitidis]KAJ4559483.1 hypothetical protein HRR78_000003 [Exophiala dermatitidis]
MKAPSWYDDAPEPSETGATALSSWDDSDFSNPDLVETSYDPTILRRSLVSGSADEIMLKDDTNEEVQDAQQRLQGLYLMITVIALALILFAARPQLFCNTILCLLFFMPYPDFAKHARWCILVPLMLYDTSSSKLESALMLCLLTTMSWIDWSYAWEMVCRSFGWV